MNCRMMVAAAWVGLAAAGARAEIVQYVNPAPGEPGHYGWKWRSGSGGLPGGYASRATHYSSHTEEPPYEFGLFGPGERGFMEVLITDGRYGWIEVERHDLSFTAYARACETKPGVPIRAGAVPSPGGALVLARGSIFASRRRCS